MSFKKSIYIFLFVSTILVAQDLPVVAVTEIKSSVDSGRYYDYKNTKSETFKICLKHNL